MTNHQLFDAPAIVKIIHETRCSLATEKRTQADIEDCFGRLGIAFVREHALSPSDIPDFMVGNIVIEVKIKGTRRNIYKQLCRYAKHDDVQAIVLVTSVAMLLPAQIENKPTYVASLSRAWL